MKAPWCVWQTVSCQNSRCKESAQDGGRRLGWRYTGPNNEGHVVKLFN